MRDIQGLIIAAIGIFQFAIVARILLSWVEPYPRNPIHVFLHRLTEPYLEVFRNFIPRMGMIDISPIIALLALGFVQGAIQRGF